MSRRIAILRRTDDQRFCLIRDDAVLPAALDRKANSALGKQLDHFDASGNGVARANRPEEAQGLLEVDCPGAGQAQPEHGANQ